MRVRHERGYAVGIVGVKGGDFEKSERNRVILLDFVKNVL